MRDMMQNNKKFVCEYDKRFKAIHRKLQEPKSEKQRTKWFISGLQPYIKKSMEWIYQTYVDALQVVVEIESQPWRQEQVGTDILDKLNDLNNKLSLNNAPSLRPPRREI